MEFKESKILEPLSAGICDTCKNVTMINIGGSVGNEPAYMELYCKKERIFIEPLPKDEQMKECDNYEQGKSDL